MNTAAKVMQSVTRRGYATISHVIEDYPELKRDQVMKALQNAAQKGRLRRDSFAQEQTRRGVRRVAVYVLGVRHDDEEQRNGWQFGRVASVWDMAQGVAR